MRPSRPLLAAASRLIDRLEARGLKESTLTQLYSKYVPTPLSVQAFLDNSHKLSQIQSFNLIRHQVPIRLSHIMQELMYMEKHVFGDHPAFGSLLKNYADTFSDLYAYSKKPEDEQSAIEFGDTIFAIRERHFNAVEKMAAVTSHVESTYKDQGSAIPTTVDRRMQYFLGRFYMSRLGTKMLMSQYLKLYCDDLSSMNGIGTDDKLLVGNFAKNLKIVNIVHQAYEQARVRCQAIYGEAPELQLRSDVRNGNPYANPSVIIDYVPSHLEYMLFELLKNALRTQVEMYRKKKRSELKPIRVELVQQFRSIHINIEDNGAGMSKEKLSRLFRYSYIPPSSPDESKPAQLGGQGYGVTHSKMHARYLQGDLNIISSKGVGTCARISLRCHPSLAVECVPVYNAAAKRHYESPEEDLATGEWSRPRRPLEEYRDERQPVRLM